MNILRCPQCGLSHVKRNGLTHYGKQNYRCKDCDRQFVEDSQHIGEELKDLIKVLLLERLSLRGICRCAFGGPVRFGIMLLLRQHIAGNLSKMIPDTIVAKWASIL